MERETLDSKIPKILQERLLIDDQHRQILNAIENLSPKDTGYLYVPGARGRDIPGIEDIATEAGMPEKEVRKNLKQIKKIWNISDDLPTNNGLFDEDEALVSAISNQHKLRWDEEIKDYRVPRVHIYNSEMGTGTLYTRNKAFEGERIFRQALGIDDMLNSYIMQGGVMPQVMSMFGKLKTERASLTGLNKTGEPYSQEELDTLKEYLELAQKDPVTGQKGHLEPKQIKNLEEFVVNTINSMPEAARSVAYELAPLVQNIDEKTPIHIFYSYNDDFNMDEVQDLLIASMRLVRQKAKEANEKIPQLRSEMSKYRTQIAQSFVNIGVAEHIRDYFSDWKEELPKGKKLRQTIDEEMFREDDDGNYSPGLKKFRKDLKKQYKRETGWEDGETFERFFDNAKRRFFYENASISDIDIINSRLHVDEDKKSKIEEKIPAVRDEITELEQYQAALKAEESEGHAWFTQKIAVNPTESKAMRMVKKENYKKIYEDYLIPTLEDILGRKLNINLHTDREMSVYIPDPGLLHSGEDPYQGKLYGTILTSIPRTNRQRSNEPTLNSYSLLTKKHESSVASRLAAGKERPKTVEDFDKHHSLAFSDVAMTSWGAEGELIMPKIVVAPNRADGEYRDETETVYFLKSPTRHDTGILSELAKKGNRGTWEVKRMEKGGPTTGNTIHIMHPDRSQEWIFVHDNFYETVADKYGEKISELEGKLSRARSPNSKRKLRKSLDTEYQKIRQDSELNNVFLVNDTHFGSVNEKGTPNNIDYTRASQLAALQSMGLDRIDAVTGTEFLHGKQKYRAHDASMEGHLEDPISSEMKTDLLARGLRKRFSEQGFSPLEAETKVNEYLDAYKNEQMHSRSTFRPDDQVDMFRYVQKPVFDEMLTRKKPVYVGSGNHFRNSTIFDEASLIKNLFDLRYEHQGLIKAIKSQGNSFTIHPIRLPGEGKGIMAMLAHKMWSGNTEISKLSSQASGTREDARVFLTADRHHPGMAVEKERFYVLDSGKQTTMDYVTQIGKSGSPRGTLVAGYHPKGEQIYSTRFFLDDVVDPVIDWSSRVEKLRYCRDTLDDELKGLYEEPV